MTCSGVNVAVLRNERVSMRGEKADAPRDGIVVGSHHQYQQQLEPRVRSRYCSRARAHGTTNPNQYHIFATLPTSVQFPLPFLALGSLPTHTTPQHQIPLRKLQSSLTPHTEEAGNDYNSYSRNAGLKSWPGSRRSWVSFCVCPQLLRENAEKVPPLRQQTCPITSNPFYIIILSFDAKYSVLPILSPNETINQ